MTMFRDRSLKILNSKYDQPKAQSWKLTLNGKQEDSSVGKLVDTFSSFKFLLTSKHKLENNWNSFREAELCFDVSTKM